MKTVITRTTRKPLRAVRLGYMAMSKGVRLRRANRVERFIVHWFNSAMCALFGHDRSLEGITEVYNDDGSFDCVACCRKIKS